MEHIQTSMLPVKVQTYLDRSKNINWEMKRAGHMALMG